MKQSVFLTKVKEELDHLRTNATSEEISKLSADVFDYNDSFSCIYGLMTGNCKSSRAQELFSKSLTKDTTHGFCYFNHGESISKQPIKRGNTYTPLEVYLYTVATRKDRKPSAKHKRVIAYLKGEIPTIKL